MPPRTGKIQPPHAHEFVVEHFFHATGRGFKALQANARASWHSAGGDFPGPARKSRRVRQCRSFRGAWGHGRPGKIRRWIQGLVLTGSVLGNSLNQSAAVRGKAAIGHAAEIAIVSLAHVFQHAQGNQGVEAPGDVAVIVLDEFHAAVEPFGLARCRANSICCLEMLNALTVTP